MNELEQLIYDTPNNMQLGQVIREKYSHLNKQVFIDGTVYPVSRATVNNRRHDATTLKSQEDIDYETDQEEESLYEDFHTPETQLELPLT